MRRDAHQPPPSAAQHCHGRQEFTVPRGPAGGSGCRINQTRQNKDQISASRSHARDDGNIYFFPPAAWIFGGWMVISAAESREKTHRTTTRLDLTSVTQTQPLAKLCLSDDGKALRRVVPFIGGDVILHSPSHLFFAASSLVEGSESRSNHRSRASHNAEWDRRVLDWQHSLG